MVPLGSNGLSWVPSKCEICTPWLSHCEHSSLSAQEKLNFITFIRAIAGRRHKRPVAKERIKSFFPTDKVAKLVKALLVQLFILNVIVVFYKKNRFHYDFILFMVVFGITCYNLDIVTCS